MTPDDALTAVKLLSIKLNNQRPDLERADQYYAGTQPLSFLAPDIQAQVGDRLRPLNVNWARKIVDTVVQRTYVEGFGLGEGGQADEELWRLWQANGLDEWSQMGNVDTLVHGRSFMSVWGNDEDPETPRITLESAHQVVVDYSPADRSLRSALKRWTEDKTQFATLYLPDEIRKYSSESRQPNMAAGRWDLYDVLDNPLGAVPIVPFVNRPRVLNLDGESELADVMGLIDAIGKLSTDMLLTSEFHAMPRRWATGIQIPAGEQREVLQAEVKAYWDQATKGKTWLAGEGVNFGQFAEATLDNFVSAINLLTSEVAAIGGLPPDDLGLTTTNPASAEARRAADTTLVLRTKEKHQSWSGSHERVMCLAVAARDGRRVPEVTRELRNMETFWRSPEIQTEAQTADAATKLHAEGIIDTVAAQEKVGLSPVTRKAIADRRATEANTAATADVQARLALSRELQATDGLTQNAALAAVGLLQAAATNRDGSTPTTP